MRRRGIQRGEMGSRRFMGGEREKGQRNKRVKGRKGGVRGVGKGAVEEAQEERWCGGGREER